MDYGDVVGARRSARAYRDETVPREVLERITNAAVVRAPSAGFSQGLRLVVVTDPDTRARDRDGRRRGGARGEGQAALEGRRAGARRRARARGRLPRPLPRRPDKLAAHRGSRVDWPAPYWYVDAGAAMMLLMLGDVAEGLAASRCSA